MTGSIFSGVLRFDIGTAGSLKKKKIPEPTNSVNFNAHYRMVYQNLNNAYIMHDAGY